jgi:hypothetical protein
VTVQVNWSALQDHLFPLETVESVADELAIHTPEDMHAFAARLGESEARWVAEE